MAYSTQRAVSDGTLQLLMISIEFFDQSEISVYFNNIPTTAYTWATSKSLHFNAVVPAGVEVLIRRTTDLSQVRHIFSLGAQFKDSTLDDDFKQILHIAQEAVEGANVGDIYTDLNMHGNKVTNVGTAVLDGDAVSLGQVRTESAGAWLAAGQASASATSALNSSNSAAASVVTASQARDRAVLAEGNALNSQNAAGASAVAAANSATASDTARAAAVVAQTASASSATLAQRWAAEPEDAVVQSGLYSAYHYSRKAAASATAAAASAATVNLPGMTGKALQFLRANSAETGLEYVPFAQPFRALLIGTVSFTGADPTGSVFERGSNANGSYIKYADGTMICWTSNTFSASFNALGGSLFQSTAAFGPLPFPAAFDSGALAPTAQVTIRSSSTVLAWIAQGSSGASYTAGPAFWVMATGGTATSITVNQVAIGRWRA